MDNIEEARRKITETDEKMAKLFCERMAAVKQIAFYKKERGLNIYDRERENFVIENNSAYVTDAVLKSYYITFLKSITQLSKQYQHRLTEGMKIAVSGVEGAYAHIAASRIFPQGVYCFYGDFASAYKSVESGECDCCVLPVENSFAGEVTQVSDLMCSGSLYVNGIYDLKICHSLLGLKDAKLSDIKTVVSHPQALSQCEGYIRKHSFSVLTQPNTALSAQIVAEENDKSKAAIASKKTADLYGLKVLDHDINESSANTTRFAVFSRVENIVNAEDAKFILVFKVRNEAGALAKVINKISKYNFNMRVLRSRPIKEEPWQYYFYAEIEGNSAGPNAKNMLGELSKECETVKTVGNFVSEIKI